MSERRQGGCRCGRVRFEVTAPPLLTLACHCTGCQHMTASAFSLSEGYAADALKVDGETVVGGIHGPSRHHHCDYCKSWLYTEPEGVEGYVNVRTSMFDQPRTDRPFVEVYKNEALPWAVIGAPHGYDDLPAMEEWPQLIQAFTERQSAEGMTK